MESRHEEFIRQNAGKLSARQLAKATGLSRTEIERYLERSKKTRSAAAAPEPPKPLTGPARFLLPAAVFAAALAFKFVFAHLFSQTPFFEPLSAPTPKKMDDGLYDQMALEILGGNWIGDFPLGPYRLPGYAYFLAGVYKLFGHRIDAVHFLQAGLGATSVLLVYFLSREIFKDVRAAVVSSALTLLYMPLSYFENFLLGETLAIFLTLAAVCLVVRALRGPNPAAGLLAPGLLLGVSALFRPNVLLPCGFLAVFFLLYPVVRGKAWGKGFAAAAVFSLACVAPLAPVAVRNWKLYHDFVPISAIGGVNFYLGNNAEAIGSFVETKGLSGNLDDILHESISQAEEAAGRPLKASEVSAYWSKKAFDFLAARPALAARVFGVKLNTLLNNDEMPDVLDMYFVAGFMPLLKLYRVVGFSLILLASFFAWPLLRRAEAVGPPREEPSRGGAPGGAAVVGVFLAGYALSVLAIFVSSRYRLPLVPFLA
ncbi:MAG TPA: glycosyltransferase family 39 protein, partial [Candidatus Eisenbacteria bacterium]|nr:glycosyltransferase family 39 protein [Candidatus Eisenbacteria bacterium]